MPPFDAGRFLSAMLFKTGLVVYLKDADGRYLYINRRYEELAGVPADAILGKTDADLFPPEVASLFRAQDAQVAAHGGPMIFEETIPLPAGTLSFVTEKFPLLDTEGRVYAVGGFCAEVTAQNRRADQFREDARTLMMAIPDIFYRLDGDMNLADWNKSLEEVSGYAPGELKGMSALAFFLTDKDVIADGIRESIEKGHAYREARFLTKDGREIPYFWSGAALRRPDGSVRGLVGVGRDISASKQAEKDRLTLLKLESLGLMAGGIAHDFNNMLTAILGSLSLLKESEPLSAEQRELMEATLRAAQKARGLTQQLLTFSKGGSPRTEPCAPGALIREAAAFAARGANAKLRFALDDELPVVDLDRDLFAQVLHNLVLNAVQAMEGGGQITVEARAADGLLLTVSDTGPGIPDDIIHKVFDPYFTTKEGGRGLGLAGARSIVEKHGGTISVLSPAGGGAVFSIRLPASTAARPAAARSGETPRAAGRVLVMDDDPEVSETLARMLKSLGYTAQVVGDGTTAVEEYRRALAGEPFRLVILDLTVPGGMGGGEAAERMLAIDPAARIMATSGYSAEESPLCEKPRFTAFLKKPYTLPELAQSVAAALAPRG